MKKTRKPEIVSLNQALFSLEAGNLTIDELDRRLELAVGGMTPNFVCDTFTCGTFGSCGVFGCGRFGMKI